MGRYQTKQKKMIYDYLLKHSTEHFTIEKVYIALNAKGPNVGKTTIYRFFKQLVTENKLRAYISPKNDNTCYHFISRQSEEEFHFKCECCESLIHFDCEQYNTFIKHLQETHSITVNNMKTILYGRCSTCLNT